MGSTILVTMCLAVTLCACDPNILQGLPHGVNGIAAGSHHHSNLIQDTFPGSIHGSNTGSGNDRFVFEPQQQSFQGVEDFESGAFLVGDDSSSNLGKRFNQVFQGSSNGPVILGQPNQGGRVLSDGTGAFQGNQQVFQGTATSPITLRQPIQGGRVLGDNTGAFQGNQQVFQGVQGNLQAGQNIFDDTNVFGIGAAQRFVGYPMTVTVDRYVTTTDVVFNSLPVIFTNFVKRTVTRTTHHILPTPVNDVVHITTAVVSSTSTVTFTHVNTVFTCVTRTTVDLYPVTHTSYNIVPTTYTSIITKRLPVTSTIVHTNILTDTITVTDRQYITDYQYVTAKYY